MIDSVTQRGGPRERSRFERELSDLGLTPAAEREAASLRAAVSRASTRFDPIAASRRNRYFAETLGWKKRANDVLRLVSAGAPEQSFTRAIAYWQRRSGLPADGIVGPRTWAAMRRAMDGGASREFERENGGPQPRPARARWATRSLPCRKMPACRMLRSGGSHAPVRSGAWL